MVSTSVSLRLPDELARKLNDIAKETERPKSFIIQKAIESYLNDFADLQVALDRLQDKTDKVISSGEMKKALGI
jgi:RHH-type rel operon transcriptional repressor/antitoxin RelB